MTGGTRGIGGEITKSFLERGARVVATYVQNDQAALEFKEKMGREASCLELKKFDLSNSLEVKEFYDWLKKDFGGLEVLVNNGGIRRDQLLVRLR